VPSRLERLMSRCLEDAAVTRDDDAAMERSRRSTDDDDGDDSNGVNLILVYDVVVGSYYLPRACPSIAFRR
jgi:hypothetical protein